MDQYYSFFAHAVAYFGDANLHVHVQYMSIPAMSAFIYMYMHVYAHVHVHVFLGSFSIMYVEHAPIV